MLYTAEDMIAQLGLKEHYEGGYYKFVWQSDQKVAKEALPAQYSGSRNMISLIYFLLMPGQESCWHKLLSDEIWLWHYGGTLEMTLGGCDELPKQEKTILIGPDLHKGESLQSIVQAGTWQKTTPKGDEFALVSCVVSPGFVPEDFYSHLDIKTWADES